MQDNAYESQCEVHSVSLKGSLEASSLCREIVMRNDFCIYMVIPRVLFSGHSTTDCNDVFACNIWVIPARCRTSTSFANYAIGVKTLTLRQVFILIH